MVSSAKVLLSGAVVALAASCCLAGLHDSYISVVHSPVHAVHAPVLHAEHHAPAHYSYKYGVHDAHTGDVKSASETRSGGVVKGEYSLLQPDGTTRTVHYTADDHNGFNAVVHNSGHATHHQVHPQVYAHAGLSHY